MDDKGKTDGGAEESTSGKTNKRNDIPDKPDVSKKQDILNKPDVTIILPDIAGPSGFVNLPGAIALAPKPIHKPGLSKSEQNLSQISVKDVADALKLTSVSFGTNNPVIKNLNLKDLKIPVEKNDNQPNDETATFIDLKKFMASCFKFTRETPATVSEVPVQNIQATIPNTEKLQEAATSNIGHTEITGVPTKPTGNEVIVTVPTEPPTDEKEKIAKKDSTEKKKTSGSLSERSDLALGQRDSLSSIGSNVCRICMTRGRERKWEAVCIEPSTLDSRSRPVEAVEYHIEGSRATCIKRHFWKHRLISPCNCKGSLANVHLTCLERWLNQVGRNHCELCGYRVRPDCGRSHCCNLDIRDFNAHSYPAIRTPRYTVLQALRLWFGNPRNRSHLQSDCLIFWLLSTVTAGLLAVCIVGTQYFVIEGTKFGKLDHGVRKEEGISHRITETAMDFFMAIVLCGYSVTVYLLWKDHYVMWNRWRRANVNVRLLLAPDSNPVPFVPRTDNRYSVV